jgi:stage III sporulation protein AH
VKKKFKKNQIMITALALMIAIAGYMQFSGNYLSDEELAKSMETEEMAKLDDMEEYTAELDIVTDEETVVTMLDMDITDVNMEATTPEDGTPGEAVFTSTGSTKMNLSDAKLLKEQNRAQNKSGLLEIINNSQLAESAKQSAVEKLVSLTDVAERELAAEILLEAKGFHSSIVSISGSSVDVVLGSVDLTDSQRAQIEDIVTRKTGISSENIIISALVEN